MNKLTESASEELAGVGVLINAELGNPGGRKAPKGDR